MNNVFDVLFSLEEVNIFATALRLTALDRTLDSAENFTIFAPHNRAFSSLPEIKLQNLSQDIPLLTRILSRHIIYGKLIHQDLVKIYDLGRRKIERIAIDSSRLDIDLSNGIKIQNINIFSTGISAKNGVIYPIDRVIA
jgi:uncharacterized surface protein with fasciclin (FAS1) repeats